MQITKDFHLDEFTKSMYATRNNINNNPPLLVVENIVKLCKNILQPLRNMYGSPIIITSGYRCPELNTAIGGSAVSQHMSGMAADIDTAYDNRRLFKIIVENFNYDQLIWEFGDDNNPAWIHVSYMEGARRERLRAYKDAGGSTIYAPFEIRI